MPKRRQVRALTRIYLLLLIAAAPSLAQINAGALPPAPELPFALRQVATFEYPWRIAFLPDGRMLVTEKPGRLWLVTQDGAKQEVAGAPTVQYDGGNGGLLGVFLSPTYRTRHDIYLTYSEGDEGGSSLALGHATLILDGGVPRLDKFERIWREMPKGQGGEFGGGRLLARRQISVPRRRAPGAHCARPGYEPGARQGAAPDA